MAEIAAGEAPAPPPPAPSTSDEISEGQPASNPASAGSINPPSRTTKPGLKRLVLTASVLLSFLFGTTRHLPWLAFSTPLSITRLHLFTCLCRTALPAEIHRDPPVAVAFRRNHRPRPPPSLQSAILPLRPPRGLPPVRFRPLRCLPRQSPRASDLSPAPAPPGPFHCW